MFYLNQKNFKPIKWNLSIFQNTYFTENYIPMIGKKLRVRGYQIYILGKVSQILTANHSRKYILHYNPVYTNTTFSQLKQVSQNNSHLPHMMFSDLIVQKKFQLQSTKLISWPTTKSVLFIACKNLEHIIKKWQDLVGK